MLNTFFFLNRAFYEIMWEKYCRTGQAIDDNMAHVLCMLDNQGYKHTIKIRNTHCLSTGTVFTRTHLYVTLKYRVIHKSLWDFRTRLRNNQDRHGRKEHINR